MRALNDPHLEWIEDYITGEKIPLKGPEANRQMVERFLVDQKGYRKKDVQVDADIRFHIAGDTYQSKIDLVVSVDGGKSSIMAVKCAAGSLGSREREILSGARLLEPVPIPYAVVSDGKTAIILDTLTGKKLGQGLQTIPSRDEALQAANSTAKASLPDRQIEKEKLIFRSYDSMNVNRQ